MRIQEDFKELLGLFNAHGVEYLVVGGYALAYHGAPRYTGDIDLVIRADRENAQRVLAALEEFGFGSLNLTIEDFALPDRITQLGVPPVRVDIVTSLNGVTWDDAWAGRAGGVYGETPVNFIGLRQFIANKKSVGRAKDLADLEALGEADAHV
jgi:hypothetical protein